MTNLEKLMKGKKQIAESDSSKEEIRNCIKNEQVQIILECFREGECIRVYNVRTKRYKQTDAINVLVFMDDILLEFGNYELFMSAELVYLILDKQKFYIFMKKENSFKVYTITGKYAVWINIFNKDGKDCIIFEPENEQDVCLFDILQENYGYPMAGGIMLNKLEDRFKRKYRSK